MAREVTKVELTNSTGFPRRYTVADGTAITKGTLLKLTDPRTAAASDATSAAAANPAAGVAAMDKVASDGSTSISVWTDFVGEFHASGAITLGQAIVFVASNYVMGAGSAASGAIIAGYSLETASDAEVVNCRIRL